MKLVVDNLYKDKDIFIRELISNSSDALGKLKANRNADVIDTTTAHNYEITIRQNPETREIIFKDTGIGMNEEELIKNLGTLANSGTEEFLKQYEANKEITDLQIGQFGMGFYSSFLVADKVTVITKKPDSEKQIWEAVSGSNSYVVRKALEEEDLEDPVEVGTKIILKLKEGGEFDKYLNPDDLTSYIKKNLGSISHPLYLYKPEIITVPCEDSIEEADEMDKEEDNDEKDKETDGDKKDMETDGDKKDMETDGDKKDKETDGDEKDKETDGDENDKKTDGEEEKGESMNRDAEKKKTPKTVSKTVIKKEQLNDVLPVWCRDPKEVTDADYTDFYKKITNTNETPLAHSHFVADGMYSRFRGLIYIPQKPSFQAFTNEEPLEYLSLYMKRVLVTSDFKSHFKRHYSFIKGVVDVDALPLNVSRETLQETESLKEVSNTVQRKILTLIQSLFNDDAKYKQFIDAYGNHMRLAVLMEEDNKAKEKLLSLLRFTTSAGPFVSLDEYIKRMVEGQTDIYYVSAQTETEAKTMPFIKPAMEKGIEVIYFTEIYDEHIISAISQYMGHTFKSLAKAGTKLPGDEKSNEELAKEFDPFSQKMIKLCGSVIDKVEISNMLGDASMSVVAPSYGWSPSMEKLMKGSNNPFNSLFGTLKKTLLINHKHPIIVHYNNIIKNDSETDTFNNDLKVLFQIAMLRAGYTIQSPAALSERVEHILRRANNIEPNEKFDEITKEDGVNEGSGEKGGDYSNLFGSMDGMNMDNLNDMDLGNMMDDVEDEEHQYDEDDDKDNEAVDKDNEADDSKVGKSVSEDHMPSEDQVPLEDHEPEQILSDEENKAQEAREDL